MSMNILIGSVLRNLNYVIAPVFTTRLNIYWPKSFIQKAIFRYHESWHASMILPSLFCDHVFLTPTSRLPTSRLPTSRLYNCTHCTYYTRGTKLVLLLSLPFWQQADDPTSLGFAWQFRRAHQMWTQRLRVRFSIKVYLEAVPYL